MPGIYNVILCVCIHLQVVAAAAPTTTATAIVHTVAKPPNYLALSLLNLLCCCWPLGIVGLLYSLKVRWCSFVYQNMTMIAYDHDIPRIFSCELFCKNLASFTRFEVIYKITNIMKFSNLECLHHM